MKMQYKENKARKAIQYGIQKNDDDMRMDEVGMSVKYGIQKMKDDESIKHGPYMPKESDIQYQKWCAR